MNSHSAIRITLRAAAATAGLAAGAYAVCVGVAWSRYGHPPPPAVDHRDEVLDRFLPAYDVVERHRVHVAAPAGITLDAAKQQDLHQSLLIRAIFKAREIALGASPVQIRRPVGLLAEVQSLGWGILADREREVVVGAVTKPWESDVTFHALPAERFAQFAEPGYVKIAWTLRVDPIDATDTVFSTETRAIATDAAARAKFRRYWAFVSPGVASIRWLSLRPLKREAERRAGAASSFQSAGS